jgi:hypothetical protein
MQFNLHLIEKIIRLVEDLGLALNRASKHTSICTKTNKNLLWTLENGRYLLQ